jgi:hypothetical protein
MVGEGLNRRQTAKSGQDSALGRPSSPRDYPGNPHPKPDHFCRYRINRFTQRSQLVESQLPRIERTGNQPSLQCIEVFLKLF